MLVDDARAVVASTLYGGRPPSQRQYDLLRAAQLSAIGHLCSNDSSLVLAARLLALLQADNLEDARNLADLIATVGFDRRCRECDPQATMAIHASVATVYFIAGEPVHSLEWALRLESYAVGAKDSRWEYRSLGIQAASHALNGAHPDAEAALADMRRISTSQGWDDERAEYLGSMAEGVLALAAMDADRAAALTSRVRKLAELDPAAKSLADLLEALALLLAADPYRASALATRVAQGVSQPGGLSLLQEYGKLLHTFSLLRDNQPLRALGQIADVQPRNRHGVCPDALRAAAYLQMHDFRSVLAVTGECVRRRTKHNIWQLLLVLICRAMANFRLENPRVALREAGEGLAFAQQNNPAAAFSILPPDELTGLFGFVENRLPGVAPEICGYREILARVANHSSPAENAEVCALATLSEREQVVARRLRGRVSFRQIADELHVSTGTVKSQAVAVYRKLGVGTRDDAVRCLEGVGFYEV